MSTRLCVDEFEHQCIVRTSELYDQVSREPHMSISLRINSILIREVDHCSTCQVVSQPAIQISSIFELDRIGPTRKCEQTKSKTIDIDYGIRSLICVIMRLGIEFDLDFNLSWTKEIKYGARILAKEPMLLPGGTRLLIESPSNIIDSLHRSRPSKPWR